MAAGRLGSVDPIALLVSAGLIQYDRQGFLDPDQCTGPERGTYCIFPIVSDVWKVGFKSGKTSRWT